MIFYFHFYLSLFYALHFVDIFTYIVCDLCALEVERKI